MSDDSKYIKAFVAEAEEDLQDMNRALLELEKNPGRRELIDEIFRHAHTIKGGAAAMGYEAISTLAHEMEYLIDMLNFNQSGLIWVLMGKQAQSYEVLIGEQHKVFTCTHPAFAAYLKAKEWDCNDVFNKVNRQLVEYKKEKIRW